MIHLSVLIIRILSDKYDYFLMHSLEKLKIVILHVQKKLLAVRCD